MSMRNILKAIGDGEEEKIRESISCFNEKNKANFKIGESPEDREEFCSVLLSHFKKLDWCPETISLALNALKIYAREHDDSGKLTSVERLTPLVNLAKLDKDAAEVEKYLAGPEVAEKQVIVIVEAVKCLCNLVLNNQHIIRTLTELGCLAGLRASLSLCSCRDVSYDVVFFSLRLLFLITALAPEERARFRDHHDGLLVMLHLLDASLFGLIPSPTAAATVTESNSEAALEQGEDPANQARDTETSEEEEHVKSKPSKSKLLVPVRDSCFVLPSTLADKTCQVLSEILKIVFNLTVDWTVDEDDNDEMKLCLHLTYLLRVMMCSLPPMHTKATTQTLINCCEVIMNLPYHFCRYFLLPPDKSVTPTLSGLFPSLYDKSQVSATEGLYCCEIDCNFEGWNMAAILSLLNHLNHILVPESSSMEHHSLSVLLGVLALLSKGNRIIRRFLKTEILPPLKEVKDRPEHGSSLKSRIVRLMTAASHNCMEVASEFLFVLCKENTYRLIKHTGYGNAAGLLMSRGLLQGGHSKGQEDYSSDDQDSDTEEYESSKPNIDLVTGAPSKPKTPPEATMTEAEQEREAAKLMDLLDRLEKLDVIKPVGLDKNNEPIKLSESKEDSDSD